MVDLVSWMSSNFIKDVKNIDGKMKGRILQSLTIIIDDPVKVRGDTVQPLKYKRDCGVWK